MSEILLKIPDQDVYSIAEVAKLQKVHLEKIIGEMVKEWVLEQLIEFYKAGEITIWKASDIYGVNLRQMVDLFEKRNVPIQMGRVK